MNFSKQSDRRTILQTNSTSTSTTPHSPSTLPQKRPLDGDSPMLNKKHQFTRQSKNCTNYTQACLLLHAIEINRRQLLNPRCIAHLANYVVKAWETNPDETKVRQLYQLMQNLLSTTAIKQPTLENALITFCQNTASTPTPCPSVTLLIAIGYIERLNKKYDIVKGTVGCGSRLIIIAYLMAAKFLHDNLRLIIHIPTTSTTLIPSPSQPTTKTSPSIESTSHSEKKPATTSSTSSISSVSVLSPTTPTLSSIASEPLNPSSQTILPTSPPTSPPSLDKLIACSVMSPNPHHLKPITSGVAPLTPPHIARNITTTSTSAPMSEPESSSQSSSSLSATTALLTKDSSPLPPPPTSTPTPPNERYMRIMRLELEFLHFLDYDLSTADPAKLVHWAHTFGTHSNASIDDCCTSADEGDDEMEDDDDGLDTCTLD
ncbi:unnamed protein product [Absidia cylindrospora]